MRRSRLIRHAPPSHYREFHSVPDGSQIDVNYSLEFLRFDLVEALHIAAKTRIINQSIKLAETRACDFKSLLQSREFCDAATHGFAADTPG